MPRNYHLGVSNHTLMLCKSAACKPEKQYNGTLCISICIRFASVERPVLNNNQIMMPMQAHPGRYVHTNRPAFPTTGTFITRHIVHGAIYLISQRASDGPRGDQCTPNRQRRDYASIHGRCARPVFRWSFFCLQTQRPSVFVSERYPC